LELQDHQQARVSADHIAVAGVLSARRRLVAAGVLGAAAFCYVTGENLPVGLLPVMSASLHSSLSATGLLVTIYAPVVVALAPLTHLTRHVPVASCCPAC
jgi:predicted MFS family arabinose efflux permease